MITAEASARSTPGVGSVHTWMVYGTGVPLGSANDCWLSIGSAGNITEYPPSVSLKVKAPEAPVLVVVVVVAATVVVVVASVVVVAWSATPLSLHAAAAMAPTRT